MSAPLNLETIQSLALQGLSVQEIADKMNCRRETIYKQARNHHLQIKGLKPRSGPVQNFGNVAYLKDEDISKRIKQYAAGLGIKNECDVRKATPEELARFDGLKPPPRQSMFYQKWSDV